MIQIGKQYGVLLYGLMNGLFYAWNAAFCGFMSAYFLTCGMTAAVLSSVLAAYMVCCFAGALFWGRMCDRFSTNRKIFLFCFLAVMVTAGGSFLCVSVNRKASVMLYLLMGSLLASLGACQDAWMLRVFQQDGVKYGRARAVGSFGYALSMLITGILIKRFGWRMILFLEVGLGSACFLLAYFLPEGTYVKNRVRTAGWGTVRKMFADPVFLFLLVFLFLEGLADSPVTNMKTVFMQAAGGDVAMLGLDSFLGVTLQAVLIFFSGKILKINARKRLIIAALTDMINMMLVATAVNPFMVMAGTLCWNVSFSFRLPTERELIEKHTDPSVRNIAHSLADAVVNNMAAIIALSYSGQLISVFGCRFVAVTGFVIMAAALIMTAVPENPAKKKKVLANQNSDGW